MYFVDKTLFFLFLYLKEKKKKVVGVFEALNGQRNLRDQLRNLHPVN